MIKEVKLPEVSENIENGDVIKILVSVGDNVKLDQPLIELETDKAMFEVPSTEEGVVKEILVKEGDVINIGSVIAKIDTNSAQAADSPKDKKVSAENNSQKDKTDDKTDDKTEEESEDKTEEESEDKTEEESEDKTEDKTEEETGGKSDDESEEKSEKKTDGRSKEESGSLLSKINEKELAPASPSVRRLARELGIEISNVNGSGISGRITEEDVKSFVKNLMTNPGAAAISMSGKSLPDFSKWGDVRSEPMNKVRAITAESMTYAWTTPMVTQFDKADITLAEEFRKKYAGSVESKGGNLTITSILVKICTEALRKFPQFNSSIDLQKKEIIYKKYFNVGIAVDTDRGLLVPVIRNTNKKSVTEISAELNVLAEKARTKKITPDEMDGGNFTISNLGGIGGTAFTPIVYSPQVAILGVSRASKEAVFRNEVFEPRMMLPLMLTYDHRIIDGADAARFLRWICEALENPMTILL